MTAAAPPQVDAVIDSVDAPFMLRPMLFKKAPAQLVVNDNLRPMRICPNQTSIRQALTQAPVLLQLAPGVPVMGAALYALHTPAKRRIPNVTVTAAAAPPHTVEVVKRLDSPRWAWVEHLRDPDPHFVQRTYHPRQVIRDQEIANAFGTATPHSGDFLLHYAGDPPAGVKRQPIPVVLVHGATKNGNFWWDPQEDGSNQGLPQHLRDQGFSVYAITFAHSQDDNSYWAQSLANAITRVKQVTGASQVDVIGHSKGGVPARMYPSNFREPWMTEYRGDVRRLMLIAAPNGGLDYSFRHPAANPVLACGGKNPHMNAPMSWDYMLGPLGLQDERHLGFSKDGPDYWPGQRQMLATWDKEYALPPLEQDWYTTYYGGVGFASISSGIQRFIDESGHFAERLSASAPDPKVEVALLAGNKANIPNILNEYTGPSDGLLFVKSALDVPDQTNVVAEKVMPLHHKALVSEPAAYKWITDTLLAEHPKTLSPAQRQRVLQQGLTG